MIGYVVAFFAILPLVLGGTTFYYKDKYDEALRFKEEAIIASRQQEEYIKLLKHQSKRQLELTYEQHKLEMDIVSSDLNSLRKQTNKSILPRLPANPRNPNEITFDREKLDKALQGFRNEIAELIGEGSYCQVDLSTLNDWLEKQRNIFGSK